MGKAPFDFDQLTNHINTPLGREMPASRAPANFLVTLLWLSDR